MKRIGIVAAIAQNNGRAKSEISPRITKIIQKILRCTSSPFLQAFAEKLNPEF
jgi:hypothetical protein